MGGTLDMMNAAYQQDDSSPSFQESQVNFEFGMKLAEIERAVILQTLRRQNFNRTRSARVLGIGIRTLQRKLKQYGGWDLDLGELAEA